MNSVNPYLNFPGTTEEAMLFYKAAFGTEFTAFSRFKDSPGHEKMPEEEWDLIMHAALSLGNGCTLMATDTLPSMGQKLTVGNNMYICVQTNSEAETDKLYNALSQGGRIEMPLNKTFWGAYCGMFADKFGIQWMLNFDMSGQGQ